MKTTIERLQETVSPFLLFLATFRRNAKSSAFDISALGAVLTRELERVQEQSQRDPELVRLFERVRYALVATADQVVLSSPWQHRAGWSMQLFEADVYGTREGGQRFFQLVDETLADTSEDARALAYVLFHCMGLGFQGALRNDKSMLARKREQLFEKTQVSARLAEHLAPDAYGRNSTKGAMKLPAVGALRLVLVGIAAVVFALLSGGAVTKWKIRTVEQSVDQLVQDINRTNG